ncbi:peptidoglycan editing factor PgeF [Rickettsiales bacterium]|nr:peptidoglycan editing factor PgeF [Rickettsiales bacterium]
MLKTINSSLFNNFKNLKHGTIYAEKEISKTKQPVNFSYSVDENPKIIDQNYQNFSKLINISEENIKRVKQSHSSNVIVIDDNSMPNYHYDADALITNLPNVCLAITTADCLPIFIYAEDKKYIANIHAGWRGAKDLIIEKTVAKLSELGCNPVNMTAAIMPAISVGSYEVGEDFYNDFLKENDANKLFFNKINTSVFFNLKKYANFKLQNLNINKVEILSYNTFNTDYLFSHRATTKKNRKAGRNLNFLIINDE